MNMEKIYESNEILLLREKLKRLTSSEDFETLETIQSIAGKAYTRKYRIYRKEQLKERKKLTREIDMEILFYLSENPEATIKELSKVIPAIWHLILRLDVMNHYEIVRFYEDIGYVTQGRKFGEIDISTLPLHADQIPLKPREKLIYWIIKECEPFGGTRTVGEITSALVARGDKVSASTVSMALPKLRRLGIVDRTPEPYGYYIWKTTEDIYISEDPETLMMVCRMLDPENLRRVKNHGD